MDVIQLLISGIGVVVMLAIHLGTQKVMEGKQQEQIKNLKESLLKEVKSINDAFGSVKQLCVKHQEELQFLDRQDGIQDTKIENHELRIHCLEDDVRK